jgi:hypothetical protein
MSYWTVTPGQTSTPPAGYKHACSTRPTSSPAGCTRWRRCRVCPETTERASCRTSPWGPLSLSHDLDQLERETRLPAPVVASAIIDRLLQTAPVLNVRGHSCRMRGYAAALKGSPTWTRRCRKGLPLTSTSNAGACRAQLYDSSRGCRLKGCLTRRVTWGPGTGPWITPRNPSLP